MAENDACNVKAEECCSGVGTSPPSSMDVSPEQSHGPQMKRKRGTSTNCHQCHKNKEDILQCKKCNKQYCITCADKWYPNLKGASFAESCPMCRNICNCGACLQSKGAPKMQDLQITREESLYVSKYTIRVLLPSLKKFVEQSRDNDVAELLARAKGVAGIHNICGQPTSERSCSCLTSDGWSIDTCKASSRDQADENYLYCPLASDTESDLQHFQFHFSNGQPVIVRKVLSGTIRLSWEPTVLERVLRICCKNGNNPLEICVLDCSNWTEEIIPMAKFFEGYSNGMFDKHGYRKILKLEDWPLSGVFHEQLPRHYTELIRCLPYKHYTHPAAGSLNVPAKLPVLPILNVGPKISFRYGPHGNHEGSQWDSITKLHYTLSDRVNILMHVASSTLQELSSLEKLDKCTLKDHEDAEAGTLWDVFRKQDVPKLEEYLRKYDHELRPILQHQTVHSIHDQTFYLTMEHKRRLKDEYGIEPWTFLQKLGDAVIIPARCLYQSRNLKSCIHVTVDFVSPECLAESDHLSEKLARITPDGILEEATCQAKNLILHAIQEAVEDLEKIA